MKIKPKPISHDYVFNYIMEKLSDTFDHYRDRFPSVAHLEQKIVSSAVSSSFEAILHVIAVLKEHALNCDICKEILDNFTIDFYHGIDPDNVKKHQGKYYYSEVTRTNRA